MIDRTETAPARAPGPHDEKRRRMTGKTLPHVGALRLLAHGVETPCLNKSPHPLECTPLGKAAPQPWRFSDNPIVIPLIYMTHGHCHALFVRDLLF